MIDGTPETGRRLHGRRGLKFDRDIRFCGEKRSPPSRAAWIEISGDSGISASAGGRRLHGRRGLKYMVHVDIVLRTYRSPPSRAAWIEINPLPPYSLDRTGSPPSRAAWIEISQFVILPEQVVGSPPSRAAWIEIGITGVTTLKICGRRLHGRRGLK